MSDVSQEDYDDFVHYSSARSAELRTAHRELEKNLSELQESVLEMAKRQHTIMGALLVVAEKFDIDVEKDDEMH